MTIRNHIKREGGPAAFVRLTNQPTNGAAPA